MLCSSFTFGSRQALYPANPMPLPTSVLTASIQSQTVSVMGDDQTNVLLTSWRLPSMLFFSHMSSVFRSVTVPSPLSAVSPMDSVALLLEAQGAMSHSTRSLNPRRSRLQQDTVSSSFGRCPF